MRERATASLAAGSFGRFLLVGGLNTAVAYEVDASWPKKPANVSWAEMSGVAVDAHDNIYLFTRARPPVRLLNCMGMRAEESCARARRSMPSGAN